MTIEFHNPNTVHAPGPYTHLVTVQDARLLFIAGQVALDKEGQLVGEGDLHAQMVQAFTNIQHILQAAGADFSRVVKLTIFVVDYQFEHRSIVGDVLNQFTNPENPPANTLLGIQSLARPEMLVEVEAVAAIDLTG